MRSYIFTPDVGLDWRSIFHLLMGIIVGFGVQHINQQKVNELQKHIAHSFVDILGPHIKKLPEKVRKHIDLQRMTEPLWYHFDLHSVLMVAFFWEALEIYLEQGLIIPGFSLLIPGTEHRVNRLILDPLMLVVGYWLVRAFPKLFRPAVGVSVVLFSWLVW